MYYIGIDLGGTNIRAGIVSEEGIILAKDDIATRRERSYQEIIKDMATLTLKLINTEGISINDVKSIGIGTPGTSDNVKGVLGYSNNFNFHDVPMREEMQKHINLPVYLENDANCAALAENIAGAAKGSKDSISITLGTGVGSGIIIDGKIYNGFNKAAAEMGHTVIAVDGIQCSCGRKGCWEMYSSATALISQTKDMAEKYPSSKINEIISGNTENIVGKTPFIAAKQGDKAALEIVENYIGYLAEGIVNVINAFQPEILTIGGGISNEGDYLLTPLKGLVSRRVYSRGDIKQTIIKISEMGDDTGIIGAAMIGADK
ncbi:MAG: ROK family protein [Clostridia bacterium]|jgi:glucokinase